MRSNAPAKSEHAIQTEILLALGQRPDAHLWRQNVLSARRRNGDGSLGAIVRSGPPGTADLLGVISGVAVAIEVKSLDGRVSPIQRSWGAAFARAGGLYVVARSVEEAVAAVESAIVNRALSTHVAAR